MSLAEKLHNLVGCFCIGIKPTGSQDPYALRRQALGVVHILLERESNIDLEQVLRQTYREFAEVGPDLDEDAAVREVLDFIWQRLKGVLADHSFTLSLIHI